MKLSIALLSAIVLVKAADADDVDFLTNLVNDYKSNTGDYADFIRTASSVPAVISSLALDVATYTDDSYTTMLDDDGLDIDSLEDFATELPWYSSRLLREGGAETAETAETGAETGSSSTAASSSAAETSDSGNGAGSVILSTGAVLGAVAVALL